MPGGTGTAYPTSLTEIGLSLEATKGTLASAPEYLFPVKAPKYKPDQMYIPDQTLQGSMVKTFDEVQGMRYDQHGWSAPPYLDSFMLLLIAELGGADTKTTANANTTLASPAVAGASSVTTAASVTAGSWIVIGAGATLETHLTAGTTGTTVTLVTPLIYAQAMGAAVTGLTKHQTSLLNNANQGQPPALSLWDNNGEQWRTMTACQLDELTIKGNATGLVEYTVSLDGNAAANNASAPGTSFTSVQTPAPWTFTALLGGVQVKTIEEWEFTFKRSTKPIPALTGSQAYLEYFADTLELTAKLTFVEQSTSPYLALYEAGTREAYDFTLFDQLAGAALNIHSTTAIATTGELDRSKEYCTVPLDIQPLPTATDALSGGKSPVICTVANAVTTAYAGQ